MNTNMARRLGSSNLKRLFFTTILASLVVSALIGIVIFLVGDFGETELKLLITTLAVAGFSLTSLAGAALYDRRHLLLLSYAVMAASLLGFVLGIFEIWGDHEEIWLLKLSTSVAIVAFSLAHISILMLGRFREKLVKYCLYATIGAIVSLATVLISMINFELDETGFFRLLGVLAILDVLGSISVPIVKKATSSAA